MVATVRAYHPTRRNVYRQNSRKQRLVCAATFRRAWDTAKLALTGSAYDIHDVHPVSPCSPSATERPA
jgi:hypothetical protein